MEMLRFKLTCTSWLLVFHEKLPDLKSYVSFCVSFSRENMSYPVPRCPSMSLVSHRKYLEIKAIYASA
jgi:hypothetical protein